MASTSTEQVTEEIYGPTRSWQCSKSPILVAVRPVLLDISASSSNNNNNNYYYQFTANILSDERQSAPNSNPSLAADHTEPDGSALVGRDGEHLSAAGSGIFNVLYHESIGAADSFPSNNRTKQLEFSMIDAVELSSLAAEETRYEFALVKAKEALEILKELQELSKGGDSGRGQPMTGSTRLFELSLMVNSNLGEQLHNNDRLEESMEVYRQLCRLAASSQQGNSRYLLHRFGINIGNILHQMRDYPRALKHYRLTLDRLASTGYKNLKIKLMNNIAITLMEAAKTATEQQNANEDGSLARYETQDGLISMKALLADNLMHQAADHRASGGEPRLGVYNSNHSRFAVNLLTSQYLVGQQTAMMDTLRSLVRADICHHYRLVHDSSATSRDVDLGKLARVGPAGQVLVERAKTAHAPVSTSAASSAEQQMDPSVRLQRETGERETTTTSALGAHRQPGSAASLIGLDQDGRQLGSQITARESQSRATKLANLIEPSSRPSRTSDSSDSNQSRGQQVKLSIQGDRLEMMIHRLRKLMDRSLIVGSQLLAELEQQTSLKKQAKANSMLSAFDFSLQLLSTSDTYKHLADEFRMNYALSSLLTKQALSPFVEQQQQQQARTLSMILNTFHEIETKLSEQTTAKDSGASRFSSPMVWINLCLLNILSQNYKQATRYADLATRIDKSNLNGLINLANCHYFSGDLSVAQVIYRRALAAKPGCWQASYNLAIVERRLGLGLDELDESARGRLKSQCSTTMLNLRTAKGRKGLSLWVVQSALIQQHSRVISQLELTGSNGRPASSGAELCLIASEMAESDEAAMKILQQTNFEHPYHLPTLERLVALKIKAFDYQNAMRLLIDCIRIRPDQSRWYQMLAECCRRAADYNRAIEVYKLAVSLFPRDIGCLRALTKITAELGLKSQNETYQARLARLEEVNRRT